MERNKWVVLLLSGALAGCGVSKQIVAEKDAALAETRSGLGTCQSELAGCESSKKKLIADLGNALDGKDQSMKELEVCSQTLQAANRELEGCRADRARAQREADALKAREQQLREQLQGEIDAKTVEIERLQGKLSVRVLDQILFASGSADILPRGKDVLDKIAAVVVGASEQIRVEGHADDVPISRELKGRYYSNWELSAARASSVVRYLQYGKQVAPERMEAVGRASYSPVASNATAEGRQKNRRVEIILTAAQ